MNRMNEDARKAVLTCLRERRSYRKYRPFYHLLLGYPDGKTPVAKPRGEGRIIRVD